MRKLPPGLSTRPKRRLTREERTAKLGEVAAFYGLSPFWHAIMSSSPGEERENLQQRFWALLGMAMVHDRIPALDDPPADTGLPVDRARFVFAIHEIMKAQGLKISEVFRWLANEGEFRTLKSKDATARRSALPERFRRSKASTISEAYYSLPKEARDDPKAFLWRAHMDFLRTLRSRPLPRTTRGRFPTAEEIEAAPPNREPSLAEK